MKSAVYSHSRLWWGRTCLNLLAFLIKILSSLKGKKQMCWELQRSTLTVWHLHSTLFTPPSVVEGGTRSRRSCSEEGNWSRFHCGSVSGYMSRQMSNAHVSSSCVLDFVMHALERVTDKEVTSFIKNHSRTGATKCLKHRWKLVRLL